MGPLWAAPPPCRLYRRPSRWAVRRGAPLAYVASVRPDPSHGEGGGRAHPEVGIGPRFQQVSVAPPLSAYVAGGRHDPPIGREVAARTHRGWG